MHWDSVYFVSLYVYRPLRACLCSRDIVWKIRHLWPIDGDTDCLLPADWVCFH